ncbi:hypothetical protein IscW_ISCW017956 [Ixodes scapularis]|uniref:Uncharacterized protein n=1 Tax=Ixodes scapularis TaxID=6945 RepID=B7PK99_IXOSC|nr:hypothetical protein IscW_ISCW017956 [Ixodes scapularis]|eukprot:XP_002409774.1 hypothetical protein IscW_ISCW017956 [Ixodes scapularis]
MLMEEIGFWKMVKERKGNPKKQNSASYTPAHSDATSKLAQQLEAVDSKPMWLQYYKYDTTVTSTGLCVHSEYPFLAASPGGIVHEGREEGLPEVKRPQSKENLTPEEACADDKFWYLPYPEYLKAAQN